MLSNMNRCYFDVAKFTGNLLALRLLLLKFNYALNNIVCFNILIECSYRSTCASEKEAYIYIYILQVLFYLRTLAIGFTGVKTVTKIFQTGISLLALPLILSHALKFNLVTFDEHFRLYI